MALLILQAKILLLFKVFVTFAFQEIVKTFNITRPMIPPRPTMNGIVNHNNQTNGNEDDDED